MYQPPILKRGDVENWECEIKIWQCMTDLEKKKQAPAVYLSLEGQAKQHCADIKVETLHSDSGVDELVKKLKHCMIKMQKKLQLLPMKNLKLYKDHQV